MKPRRPVVALMVSLLLPTTALDYLSRPTEPLQHANDVTQGVF